ncbi:MAG: D-alanyl-D-alanine carboxypeptidase/D-alanyl-D-alanine-endopeptidase [Pyrinomonadaceae bacterium]
MLQGQMRRISLILIVATILSFTTAVETAGLQRDSRTFYSETTQRKASPASTPTPSPIPAISPEPALNSITKPAKTRSTIKTLAELQNQISAILKSPELAPAMVGVKVVSLDTGRVLFEENSQKLLRPASNMKLYTVATALDRLSPDFHFTTSVLASAPVDNAGTIHGDMVIYGRGDPSLAARFNNGDYFKGINDLASRIAAAGVKRVEGDIVGDESYFTGPPYGSGWEWDDLTWYYGAEVSALTANDNALDLFIKPGPVIGSPAIIITGPPDPLLTVSNQVVTTAKGTRREVSLYRALGQNVVTIKGSIPLDDRGYTGGIGISQPALLFVYLLRSVLAQRGIAITGKSRAVGAIDHPDAAAKPATEIATLESPPFSVIAGQTLKPSQNLYTELILRRLGKLQRETTSGNDETSEDRGLKIVEEFLRSAGVRPESLVLSDGSGLSRNDMVTAEASVQLLTFMSRHRYAETFRAALPIAGIDGTLRNRMKGTPAENNLRAKTGSLSSAASLSGYVTSGAGEKLVFSIMVNNYPSNVEPRTACIDPIAILLASFAGKSE